MTAAALFHRVFRLRSNWRKPDDAVSLVRIEVSQVRRNLLLPHSPGLDYVVVPTSASDVSIEAGDFVAEKLGLATSLWLRLRLALLFKKKKYLRFEGVSVFSVGPKPERKRFTTFNQHMVAIGAPLDGDLISAHPELIGGWAAEEARPVGEPRRAGPNATAVVAHIYYEETWPDLAGVLASLSEPFDLIVTTVPGRQSLIEAIRRDFPEAEVEVMENRGRDVRPFLVFLERGRLDRYRFVCKVHGKKSSDGGRKSHLGSLWRRRLLFDLLAAPGLAPSIVKMFDSDPTIGMIGPSAFRLPNKDYSEALSWSVNTERVLQLAGRWAFPPKNFAWISSAERCSGSAPRRSRRCAG